MKEFFIEHKVIDIVALSVQSPVNQTNMSQSMIYANHCGGVAPYTQWTYYNTIGIYIQINTTNCHFNVTPYYYTSIAGNGLQYDLTGSDSIYNPTQTGFRIYCRSNNGWTGSHLLNFSQIEQWDVIWVGIYY